ncbi:hypothetical protein B5X24_HaOG216871 [Helicoverpa armigera]|uniref:Uncharacterized protein n=1 Tax=Helicoverpa armigera TaxID=29058 RepID=A0A2W1C252_HELAM|nr:hypothetical protein B5X24_HaOG216871 [Helicoverpa armigera]
MWQNWLSIQLSSKHHANSRRESWPGPVEQDCPLRSLQLVTTTCLHVEHTTTERDEGEPVCSLVSKFQYYSAFYGFLYQWSAQPVNESRHYATIQRDLSVKMQTVYTCQCIATIFMPNV